MRHSSQRSAIVQTSPHKISSDRRMPRIQGLRSGHKLQLDSQFCAVTARRCEGSGNLRVRSKWRWALIVFSALVVFAFIAVIVITEKIQPIVRSRAEAALEDRFDSDVDLPKLEVTFGPRLAVTGEGLALRHHGRTDVPPLIQIQSFSATMSWRGLFGKPFHVSEVHLKGLQITIPPKNKREPDQSSKPKKKHHEIPLLVDTLVSDEAQLQLLPGDPRKDPHVFLIHRLVMHSVGLNHSAPFESQLTNAVPPGEIEVKGHFGPWQQEDPGQTPLSAEYT